MKKHIIRFKDSTIELSEKPEIYLFTDESCSKSEWVPFDMNKFRESQNWVRIKILQDHGLHFIHHENIRFKLKNPDDINVFMNWMSELLEVVLKKNYVKDIEYYEFVNDINEEVIIFANCALVLMNDEYIEISADYIII